MGCGNSSGEQEDRGNGVSFSPANGNWSDPASWVGGQVPKSSNGLHVTSPFGLSIEDLGTSNAPFVTNDVTFNPPLTVTGAMSSHDVSSPIIRIRNGRPAAFQRTNLPPSRSLVTGLWINWSRRASRQVEAFALNGYRHKCMYCGSCRASSELPRRHLCR
jgi:hypothetical protein